jgi:hypothetical protein
VFERNSSFKIAKYVYGVTKEVTNTKYSTSYNISRVSWCSILEEYESLTVIWKKERKKNPVGTLDSSVADGGSWVDYVGYHLFSV